MWEVDRLVAAILETEGIEGVTFTGGEPFSQARALAEVARRVRSAGLSVFIFTGHELDELVQDDRRQLLELADVVVAGRYIEAERAVGLAWRGSGNQRVHLLSDRYGPVQMEEAPIAEFHLALDGTMTVTGFPVDATLLRVGGQG
jgi:anaerobic ribonucleoside-triphosphate reductase activating protein